MKVFLIGFMGSGKSSLGRNLAELLSWKFLDLDQLIESREGLSISEIFAAKGEMHFRIIEKATLHSLDLGENAVIALGGGACCNDQSLSFILKNGFVVYVSVEEGELVRRLKKDRKDRPLVAHLDINDLTAFVRSKLTERLPYYEKANLIFREGIDEAKKLAQSVNDYFK